MIVFNDHSCVHLCVYVHAGKSEDIRRRLLCCFRTIVCVAESGLKLKSLPLPPQHLGLKAGPLSPNGEQLLRVFSPFHLGFWGTQLSSQACLTSVIIHYTISPAQTS